MSAPTHETERERLEREANLVRARLATTIDVLDRRAHEAVDVKLQVRRNIVPIAITAGTIGAAILGGIGWGIYRIATRDSRRRHERLVAARRTWRHPERVGRYKSAPVHVEIGRKLLVGVATSLGMMLLKRLLLRPAERRVLAPAPLPPVVGPTVPVLR